MNDKVEYVLQVLSDIVESMPMDENEIAGIVESLVKENFLHPSSPVSNTNYRVQTSLFELNKEIRKIKR